MDLIQNNQRLISIRDNELLNLQYQMKRIILIEGLKNGFCTSLIHFSIGIRFGKKDTLVTTNVDMSLAVVDVKKDYI